MEQLCWKNVIGHNENIARLKTFMQRDKMPHALLFVGPEGIGKLLVAQMMAAALFCSEPERPCGKCASCRAFLAATHPDLVVVEPDGQAIKIEQIRQLQKEVSLAPYLTDKRIVILKNADKMTLPAANSLLKTLEEPVGNVVFILLADQRQLLLDTILSRCMTILFQPLTIDELTEALLKTGAPEQEAAVIAHLAEGSLSKALQLREQDGLQLRNQALEFLSVMESISMETLWKMSAEIGEMERSKLQGLILYFNLLLRDILILHCDEDSDLLCNIDIRETLAQLRIEWPKRKIFFALNEIINMQKMLRANGNARLVIEQFMIKLRD